MVKELSPLSIDKNLKLNLELDESQNYTAKGDRLELYRVLTNLVGNAIKFTDEGSVTLRLIRVDTGLVPAIKLEVQDTGPGISESDRATLFESFIPGKHKRSGSGLGLHLTRRIVEAHNGRINVATEVGKGSTFTVYLPTH
ncbi:two-component hybrid sensor and regulator [Leptolyngbya sp. NIES-2104]|nr:two-component hybrid sensor and regulator [Leptolyngbya sp. NIES-2104]